MSATNIIPFGPTGGRLPAAFAQTDWRKANEAAAGGISGGFPVLSIRGKVFRIKQRGVETPILSREGDPVPSLSIVVLATNPGVSKIYYKLGFDEGSNAPPDCFSTDGVAPDAGVAKPVSAKCATCPMNVWGSKITPSGVKVQACANSKRLALVPALRVDENNAYSDAAAEQLLRNEAFGGPMLLRLPGSALADWSKFLATCNSFNAPFYAAVARLRFDPSVAYPRPIFEGVRLLSEHEARVVAEMQALPVIARITSEGSEAAQDTAADAVPAPQTLAPAPVQAPVQVAAAPVAPVAPVVEPEVSEMDRMRARLAEMEAAEAARKAAQPAQAAPAPQAQPALQTPPAPAQAAPEPAKTVAPTSSALDAFLSATASLVG